MRLLATVGIAVVLFLTPEAGRGTESRLTGCPDPSAVASALIRLRELNWQGVTLTLVEDLWPKELFDLGCEIKAGCIVVGSKGRIINGHCECCESFTFEIGQDEAHARQERLRGITIFYSSYRQNDAISTARKFARAVGLDEAQVSTVGRESIQMFQWDTPEKPERTIAVLEIRLKRRGKLWEIFFDFGRHVIDPPVKPEPSP